MPILLRLYLEFFRVGTFSVGGGLATLPFLYDLSNRTAWFSHGEIADMIAVAESTPGAIGINMATYAGYVTAGVPGGILATLGLISPAILIITLIAKALKKFSENRYVQYAFYGLRAASLAMIAAAAWNVCRISILDVEAFLTSGKVTDLLVWKSMVLAAFLFWSQKKYPKVHPIAFIAAAAFVGVIAGF